MTHLLRYSVTAFLLAGTLTLAQQRLGQVGNAGIPTVDTIRAITDRMIFRRMLVPRDRWPALPNPRTNQNTDESVDVAASNTVMDRVLEGAVIKSIRVN